MSSLQKKAMNASAWVIIGYGSSQLLRLVSNLILTRLLVPELFGLMALVNTFIMGLYLFSDVGIKPSIIRSPRGEDSIFLNTAWTIQVIRSFILWICCLLIAFPLARFYEERQLIWLIPIVGLTTIISGFNSTSLALLSRDINVKQLTFMDLIIQIIALVVMVIWAYFQQTIWALVIGTFVSKIIQLYWSHRISSIPNRFVWDKEAVEELISFGKWIFVSTAMTFLANQSDRLILGKFFSLEMLGVYAIAFNFAVIPKRVVSQLSEKIMMPLISQKKELPRRELRQKILSKRKFLLTICILLLALMFCFGDLLVFALYPDNYHDAGWILPILALGLWPLIVNQSISKSLFAIGKPQYNALGTFLKFAYMCALLPLVLSTQTIWWGMIVIAFNDIPIYAVTNYGLLKEGFSCLKQDFIFTIILVVVMASLILIRYYTMGNLPLVFNYDLS